MDDKNIRDQGGFYDSSKTDRIYLKSVWENIKPFVKGRILDIGGNDGSLLDFYKTKNKKYILDITKLALKKAKRRGYKTYFCDMHKLPFKDSFFDTVLLINTFEHSHNPFGLLKGIKRVLKPNGVVIIDVPNARSVRQIYNLVFHGDPLPSGNSILFSKNPNHFFHYTSNLLCSVLKLSGFEKVKLFGKPPVKQPFNGLFRMMPGLSSMFATDIIAVSSK